MPKSSTFSLPEGVQFDVTGDTIDLRFDGNIEISTDLGRRFGTVHAGGDLTITIASPITGTLRAGGVLTVAGDLDAEHVHAREIVLGRQSIKCKALSADEKITIGAATIVADVIIAPEILMDPKAQGRVTVIESANERGATKIKGGFGLADYEDMFGNSEDFLAQRGLKRIEAGGPLADSSERPAPRPAATAPSAPGPAASSSRGNAARSTAPTVEDAAPPRPVAAKAERAPATRKPEPPPSPKEEDTEDPVSVSFDDLEPLEAQAAAGAAAAARGDVHQRLLEALGRITACYEGTDLPPAINELQDLVRSKDYDALRQNITEVWNGLLGFHQKRGIRPHHQVTHAFNVINNLVQQ